MPCESLKAPEDLPKESLRQLAFCHDAERALGEHHGALEEAADLGMAGVVARERTVPGHVPGDGRVEHREHRGDIALREIVVGLSG